jgi:hypothetical protein
MSKTPTSDTQTTKPRSPRRSARESLIRLVTDYAPVVPFFAALLAAQPEPKVTPPPAAAPPPSDDVSVAPSSLSRPEGCAAELRARRALEIPMRPPCTSTAPAWRTTPRTSSPASGGRSRRPLPGRAPPRSGPAGSGEAGV